jgi:hypothetical protein
MNDEKPQQLMRLLDLGLSERELFFIGRIVAAWGAIESEIFVQTVQALNPASLDELPAAMNNLQPSRVRELWKEHVVDKATGKQGAVLLEQYRKIEHTPKTDTLSFMACGNGPRAS